jgi:hypothetical protein
VSDAKKEFARQHESLSNARLEKILQAGTYSADAVEAATDELRSRGVDIPSSDVTTDQSDAIEEDDPELEESTELADAVDLTTVYQTNDLYMVNVIRNLLMTEGVYAQVWGQNLRIAHTFLSTASGGARVLVREDQLAQAREVLEKFERGEFRLEDK